MPLIDQKGNELKKVKWTLWDIAKNGKIKKKVSLSLLKRKEGAVQEVGGAHGK